MHFQYHPYVMPLYISAFMCVIHAIYGLAHRDTRGAVEYIICGLIGALWAAANALEMTGLDLETKLPWANLQYIAYAFGPLAWLVLALRFSEMDEYLTVPNILALSIIPFITATSVWFDTRFGFVRNSFSLDTSGFLPVIVKSYSPWFWIHYGYSQLASLAAIVCLVRSIRSKRSVYRYQALFVLVAFSLISISEVLFLVGPKPFGNRDLTPMVFSISALILWWGIFRVRLFRIVPLARETVFEHMASGIVVVDEQGLIVDNNAPANTLFDFPGIMIGRFLEEALPSLADAIRDDLRRPSDGDGPTFVKKEATLSSSRGPLCLELFASPLVDPQRKGVAWAIMATDVSDITRARDQITRQKTDLAVAKERERLSRDLHDDLGQVLSFAVIQSDVVLTDLERGDSERAKAHLERLRDIVAKSHENLRSFVHGIRDLEYDELPMEELIARQLELFSRYNGIEVINRVVPGCLPGDFSVFRKKQLSQITKEALNNVAKHAHAARVLVELTYNQDECALVIEDNGIGISPSGERGGAGLRIIEERARSLDGRVEIGPAETGGTRIRVIVPASEKAHYDDTDR